MMNNGQKNLQGKKWTSLRKFSNYFRIVSSGASNVVKSAASVASSIVDRDNTEINQEQVYWASFDKLEYEGAVTRRVLLVGYGYGFQVWDVEETNNFHEEISRFDGPVSSMHILPRPISSEQSNDKFAARRPLLGLCTDMSFIGGDYAQDGQVVRHNGNIGDQSSSAFLPTVVWFYSLKSLSYVHVLKFRSVVYSLRCSPRVVAVLQAAQIHCFDAATLERVYNVLTNPIVTSGFVPGSVGLGPLAVGPRWIAYSGPAVSNSDSGRINSQHLTASASFPSPASNGSLVAHYAKESSKHLAAGIVTLGDMGYKKLSRYYSELKPDSTNFEQLGSSGCKECETDSDRSPDAMDNVGMVIIRDLVSKYVIVQFRAHKSPISALCFDPSGTLLVTASVQGHNINVFRIMPELFLGSSGSDHSASYVHLYRLQRGYTNAVIPDISFSHDSRLIMISSSRGTGHLFNISPYGGPINFQHSDTVLTTRKVGSGVLHNPTVSGSDSSLQTINQQKLYESGPTAELSAVSRIRFGGNGWKSTVSGAAAAATGRTGSLRGTISSMFHICKNTESCEDSSYLNAKSHLLVFSPSGYVIQYALRVSSGLNDVAGVLGSSPSFDLAPHSGARLVVQPIQKWNICQKKSQRERNDNSDIYGESGNSDCSKIFPEEMKRENMVFAELKGTVSPVEKYHMHISEAELHMHLQESPLWARSEIYFQSMIRDDSEVAEKDASEGEIQIEKFPTRFLEVRSRNLLPVFDYVKLPIYPAASFSTLGSSSSSPSNSYLIGQLLHCKSGISDNGGFISKCSSGSLDAMDGSDAMAELRNSIAKTGSDSPLMSIVNTEVLVNNSESPKFITRPVFVNIRGISPKERRQKFVNNTTEGQKMENQFDESEEFD